MFSHSKRRAWWNLTVDDHEGVLAYIFCVVVIIGGALAALRAIPIGRFLPRHPVSVADASRGVLVPLAANTVGRGNSPPP